MTAQPVEVCRRRPNSRWTRCRCGPCRHDMYRLNKVVRGGGVPRVSREEAWAAFCGLLDKGWTPRAIADACDLPETMLDSASQRRLRGGVYRFGAHAAARLMTPGTPTVGRVGALGSMRRLRALARIGWSTQTIADRSGVSPTVIRDVQAKRREVIAAVNAEAIAGLFEAVRDRCGTSTVAVVTADREGWPQPYRWDGLDMDDPAVTPVGYGRCDGVKVSQRRR